MSRVAAGVALVVAALLAAPAATAKEFEPGDLGLCNSKRCVVITNEPLLDALSSFVYGGPQPARAEPVTLGAPYFELRFRNGYVAGIFATARLDRWLSYGVILERFKRGRWYVVPAPAAAALRRLAARLVPLRLTRVAIAKSR